MYDIIVIGAGIIGCAIARELAGIYKGNILLLEKEHHIAMHASGHNSGVIHSGFNLKPGTLKAKFCVEGSRRLRQYCVKNSIPMKQVGTLVVTSSPQEEHVLKALLQRGKQNKVPGIRILTQAELRKREPHLAGTAALFSPTGAIVDSRKLTESFAHDAEKNDVKIITNCKVTGVVQKENSLELITIRGNFTTKYLINCAGTYADHIASLCGAGKNYTIIPFRGEYFEITDASLINSMVYPPPDLEFPFLGIHLTKTVDGRLLLGPNAALAFGRESYSVVQFSPSEALSMLLSPGFLKLMASRQFRKLALRQLKTSFSQNVFLKEARKLLPGLNKSHLKKSTAGIRAQLVDSNGSLIDDFVIEHSSHATHILNAVSPGMTCSMVFAEFAADTISDKVRRVEKRL